jgi:CRP-like cAMP-binding protein
VRDDVLERIRWAGLPVTLTMAIRTAQHHGAGKFQETPMTLTQDRRAELLASAPLFAGVDAADMSAIAEHSIEVDFPDGHVIARQGEVGTGFFLIASGGATVIRDGRTIADLGPGDFFGELSVLDGRPRTAQVVAAGATVCLALASWDLEALVAAEPGVGLALLRGLATRLRDLTEADRH